MTAEYMYGHPQGITAVPCRLYEAVGTAIPYPGLVVVDSNNHVNTYIFREGKWYIVDREYSLVWLGQ